MVKLLAVAGSAADGVCRSRAVLLRGAWFATTALVGVSLVNPAMAQSVSSAGGGTVSTTGGSISGGGVGEGVAASGSSLVMVNNVAITQTRATPTNNALDVSGPDVRFTGSNTLSTTNSGGAAFNFTTGVNRGIDLTTSDNSFIGSYGVRVAAPRGFLNLNSTGHTQTLTANGTKVTGFDLSAALNPEFRFGTSEVNGFATGVDMRQNLSGGFVYFNSTGGSINATSVGINANNPAGSANIESQTAIVAPTGINATTSDGATITTSGGGTINSTTNAFGTGISATSNAGSNAVSVTVGAAIGATTGFNTGVNASTTGTSTGVINITTTAAINASGTSTSSYGIYAAQAQITTAGTVNVGADVSGGQGIRIQGGRSDVTIGSGATVTGSAGGDFPSSAGAGVFLNAISTSTVTNSGAIRATGTNGSGIYNSSGAHITNNAGGTISGTTGLYNQTNGLVDNAGTITGSTSYGYRAFGNTLNNTGVISGTSGVFNDGNVFTVNNTGGTITGTLAGGNGIALTGGILVLSNTGTVQTSGGTGGAGGAGVWINTTLAANNTISNNGTITGGSDAAHGFGVDVNDGVFVLNNNAGGTIAGGTGGIRLSNNGRAAININAGSIVTGQIFSEDGGARTIVINGTLNGAYNGGTGTGVVNFMLGSTGSMQAATFGNPDDLFTWNGGTIGGVVDAGAGTDAFISTLGAGNSATLNISNMTGFESYAHTSGILTLAGSRTSGRGWAVTSGNTVKVAGTMTSSDNASFVFNGNNVGNRMEILAGGLVGGNIGVYFNGGVGSTFVNGGTLAANRNGVFGGSGAIDATNTGTISAVLNEGLSYALGASTLLNSGSIMGGSDSAFGFGVSDQYGALTVTNNAGGKITGSGAGGVLAGGISGSNRTGGLLTLTNASGAQVAGPTAIYTQGTASLKVANSGVIAGTGDGILATGSGAVSITNNAGGTIGSGTVVSNGTFAAGGTGSGIHTLSDATVVNNGTLYGHQFATFSEGALTFTNRGSASGGINGDTVASVNAINVMNAGTIVADVYAAVNGVNGGTVVNATSGTLTGGTQGIFGEAVQFGAGTASFTNYGAASAATGKGVFVVANAATTVKLPAGSTTGSILTGSGNDTVALYSGTGTGNLGLTYNMATGQTTAGTTNDATHILIQQAGTLNASSIGTIDLGSGINTVQLRGTADGTAANGLNAGTYNLSGGTVVGASVVTKADIGTWTISGNAASTTTINAGIGGTPGSGGLLIFGATTNLTSAINVNGATIRAVTAGGFGTGTITTIDPTVQFAATGTFANPIILASIDTATDPTQFEIGNGLMATITGSITQNPAPQPLVFALMSGATSGTFVLANPAATNLWTGRTTINSGVILRGSSATISGGTILNNGSLLYNQTGSGTVAQAISGGGAITVAGLAAGNTLTFTNALTNIGGLAVTASSVTVNAGAAGGIYTDGAGDRAITIAGGVANNATGNTSGSGLYVVASSGTTTVNVAADATLSTTAPGGNRDGVTALSRTALINRGMISSSFNAGIALAGGGAIDNFGTVTGGNGSNGYGIAVSNGAAATVMLGTTSIVSGTVGGVAFQLTGTGANRTQFSNAGQVTSGRYGLETVGTGTPTITNLASGTIVGGANGIQSNGVVAISNAGIIGSGSLSGGILMVSGSTGIATTAGGSITNLAGGAIRGNTYGIDASGAATTIVNNGQISGNVNAIRTGTFADSVTLGAASVTDGTVALGIGADTLTLFAGATGAGQIDGGVGTDAFIVDGTGAGSIDIGRVVNFESRTKNGTSSLTLTGNDASTIAWTVNAGALLANAGAINAATAVTVNSAGTLGVLGSQAIGSLAGAGNVSLGANVLMLGGSNTNTLFSGVAWGTGGLVKTGTGIFTISGANTYTGATDITAGTLRFGASNVLSDATDLIIRSGATLDLNGFSDTVGIFSLFGTLTGGGLITANATNLYGGTLGMALSSATVNQVSGTTLVNGTIDADSLNLTGGTLRLDAANRIADRTALTINPGATLDLQSFNETVASLVSAGTIAGTGTLTAATYELQGGVVNANLGTGALTSASGTTTLNGTSAASTVEITGGTLLLGASERLTDTATLAIDANGTFDLSGFQETVANATIGGTLNGTGTLNAATYSLTGGTVNANLGAGALTQAFGLSTMNGTSAASTVHVAGGTLLIGASERLADTATLAIDAAGTLDLAGFQETVGTATIGGTVNGTGTLNAVTYSLTGGTVSANLGVGALTQSSGLTTLNGTAGAASVDIAGGALLLGASERMADTATLAIGANGTLDLASFQETVGILTIAGTLDGAGTLTAATYALTGATVNGNLGGGALAQVSGLSALNGTSAASTVEISGGTLLLGASERLTDMVALAIDANGVLDLAGFQETVGAATIAGVLNGSGTLTAADYSLTGATVNGNLGAGALTQVSGLSTLNGTSAASTVRLAGGTLLLGASERLADTAALSIDANGVLDLAGFQETVASAAIAGTLNGTGTLTATTYALNGATINANLGTGALVQAGGLSTLNGTLGAVTVNVSGGTLRLGASDRLAPTAALALTSGSFDLAGYNETVAQLSGGGGVTLGSGRLTVAQDVATDYAGSISGTGGLTKLGSGNLVLSGTSTYTGATFINAGILSVNGQLASNVTVAGTGRLGGNGQVGGLTIASGATLAPGNSIGTLNINGNLTVTAGAFYAVEVSPSAADRVNVTGTATLQGGTVQVLASGTAYDPLSRYTILTAAGGVTGSFTSLTSNYAFLTPSLEYALTTVSLVLRRNGLAFASVAQSANQLAVANAIQGLVASRLSDAILPLDAPGARQAFDALSGEIHASLPSALVQDDAKVRDALLLNGRRTTEGFGIWGDLIDSTGQFDARPEVGTAKLDTLHKGVVAGIDYGHDGFRASVASGYSEATYRMGVRGSSARVDSYHAGAQAGYTAGRLRAQIGGAYSWHNIDAKRAVVFTGFNENVTSAQKGHTLQGFGEVGYALFDGPTFRFEPFVGYTHLRIRVNGTQETAGTSALTVESVARNVDYTTAGIHMTAKVPVNSTGTVFEPRLTLAWQHGWGGLEGTATSAFSGSTPFTVTGTALAGDAVKIDSGFDLSFGAVRIGAAYVATAATHQQDHGAKVTVGFRF